MGSSEREMAGEDDSASGNAFGKDLQYAARSPEGAAMLRRRSCEVSLFDACRRARTMLVSYWRTD